MTPWGGRILSATDLNRFPVPPVYDDVTDVAAGRVVVDERARAFAAFYADTVGPLGGYAYRLVGDPEVAADVVHEAFTRLASRWVRARKPGPYLFHVVTGLARAAAADRSVWDAVERLPARYREVVLLHYYGDLPLADVAAAVRRPAGTVEQLLAEARDLLATTREEGR